MSFIYLNKLELPETVRVKPDDIRLIKPMDVGPGSIVIFNNYDVMRYRETPREIQFKEWRLRYMWPNLERLIMALLGGVIGSLLSLLLRKAP
jgi:hypothetical protein